jgi:protein gp37
VSVEDQQWAGIRIPALVRTPAAVRFLSCEPLLGPINLNPWLWEDCPSECVSAGHALEVHRMRTGNLDWVITGGESGPNFRPTDPEWFQQIRDQCVEAGVAYLHKQNGGIRPKANGRELDGRTWDQYPEHQ